MTSSPVSRIPAHLPKRLTISFPIWGLMDTAPTGAYHDLDRMVREHVERGFNCIRLESGAGFTHDLQGNRLPPAQIHAPFGRYGDNRQLFVMGGEGKCDLLQRLIDLCEVCQKYDVYLILSSWYYLHTYWYAEPVLNERLLHIPVEERFMVFAKFLHYILRELEERGLADRIAMAEIFNEMGDLPGLWERAGEDRTRIDETFRASHEEALAFLMAQHPHILFSCDDTAQAARAHYYPRNAQGFNGHNYFLWDVYTGTLEGELGAKRGDFFRGEVSNEDVSRSYEGRRPHYSPDWIERIRYCHDVDEAKIPAMEEAIERRMSENWAAYVEKLEESIRGYQYVIDHFPGIPVICGEGMTYCSNKRVLWEEKSDLYWNMVTLAMRRYKETGLWGTVIKTCCGPEDPCWHLCRDKLLQLNQAFLKDE